MQGEEHLKDLSEIRSMMERSSKFLSLSGLAGVAAGVVGLLGAGAAYWRSRSGSGPDGSMEFYLLDALIVFVVAVGVTILFTTRMAKKKGLPVRGGTGRILPSLLVPLGAGAVFCILLLPLGQAVLIPASMLVFYGLALFAASAFTYSELKVLALSEVTLGLGSMLFIDLWPLFWALGFGAAHIIYGVTMYRRHER